MVREARFHGRRDPQSLVNPAEVVVGEVQAVGSPEVLPLFAERVRQPGQAAHGHADCQILPFNVARANQALVGIAHDWDLLRMRDVGRAVPMFFFGLGVHLGQLGEVATVGKRGK